MGVDCELQALPRRFIAMSIFETLGLVWIILTSSLATIGLFYLAYVGLKSILQQHPDLPAEVREMFKIAK